MADINIESGVDCTRTFTIKDAAGVAIALGASTVVVRIRPSDAGGEVPVQRAATVTNANGGVVSFDFLLSDAWRINTTYDVRFVVDPAPNGTSGRFPDGVPLTMQVWRKT